ncbi:MAG TPA: PIN domain-containing protein [bacterium]|nr:PIN domain-containing protein [bacterium]
MVIFIDTSALIALAVRDDVNHVAAVKLFDRARGEGHVFLLHNLILVECVSLLHRRKGHEAACRLVREIHHFETLLVDEAVHHESLENFVSSVKRKVSLVDQVSFVVMKRKGIKSAFAFDDDFRKQGFTLYGQG